MKNSESTLDELKRANEKLIQIETELRNRNKDLESQLAGKDKELKELQQKLNEVIKRDEKEMKKRQEEIAQISKQHNPKIKVLDAETIQNLERIEDIGFGNGGRVIKVAKKKFYALKEMIIQNKSTENFQHFLNEYEIMNMLDHPNILKTFGIFLSDSKKPPAILLEYCPHNLDQAIKNKTFSNVQIVCAIFQIAEGMRYVHFRNIIHRDLKPSNILIAEDGIMKIADFGISKLMSAEEQSMTRGLGTQKFMAPEIINEEEYNEKSDIYSFGVLVYYILSNGEFPKIKIRDICLGKKAEIPSSFTSYSKQLIDSCWNFVPNNRPSFKEICEDMEKNKFSLLELTKSESNEVLKFVKEFKTQIPLY